MTSSASTPLPQQLLARVISNRNVAPQHFSMEFLAPHIAQNAQAGQFVHVLPREAHGCDPLLRRAFSIMVTRGDGIEILFRVGGNGTLRLSQVRAGETLDVLGPLGQPFDKELFHVKQEGGALRRPILIGGGVGVPPMVFLGKTFKETGFEPLMLLGARGADEVLATDEFRALGVETRIATDDGSLGHQGRVTDLLEVALQSSAPTLVSSLPPDSLLPQAVIYACGPLPMLRAVAAMAARFGVPCQVSLEENMPCGIGVCNGCVVAMKQDKASTTDKAADSEYGRYRRICVAGPAVWASEVDWEAV